MFIYFKKLGTQKIIYAGFGSLLRLQADTIFELDRLRLLKNACVCTRYEGRNLLQEWFGPEIYSVLLFLTDQSWA